MSIRFAKFEVPNSHLPIYINRSMVRTVRAASSTSKNTVLTYDSEHTSTVVGSPDEIVQRLED